MRIPFIVRSPSVPGSGPTSAFPRERNNVSPEFRRATATKFIGFVHLGRYEDALATPDPTRITVGVMQDVIFIPYYDPIRSDPRFVNFLATFGMTEAHERAQVWRAAHPPEKSVTT